mmetsp:Transcript_16570/g.53963  ORF Transcript_16570/g.53963 Transcript_16570/m.53963 type:complete len:296 (-) Transcript_16570:1288-2175(-)
MRCWTSNKTASPSSSARSRSIMDRPYLISWHLSENTVAGSCFGSPHRTSRRVSGRKTINDEASSHCAASSRTTSHKSTSLRRLRPAPLTVANTTRALLMRYRSRFFFSDDDGGPRDHRCISARTATHRRRSSSSLPSSLSSSGSSGIDSSLSPSESMLSKARDPSLSSSFMASSADHVSAPCRSADSALMPFATMAARVPSAASRACWLVPGMSSFWRRSDTSHTTSRTSWPVQKSKAAFLWRSRMIRRRRRSRKITSKKQENKKKQEATLSPLKTDRRRMVVVGSFAIFCRDRH